MFSGFLKDAKMPMTVAGQLFSRVRFLSRSGLTSCVCLSNCRGACCLHCFMQSLSLELEFGFWLSGVGLFDRYIQHLGKRRTVPPKSRASGPMDEKLCSTGISFTAACRSPSHRFSVLHFPEFFLKAVGFYLVLKERSTTPRAA